MSVYDYTANYAFRKIDFNSRPFHEDEWANWDALDAILADAAADVPFVVATGAANTFVATYSPAETLIVGRRYSFKTNAAVTGASTLNINGLGAKPLKINGADTPANFLDSGAYVSCVYDGTNFNITSPQLVTVTNRVSTAPSGLNPSTAADDFTVDNDAAVGMSLLTASSTDKGIWAFGNPTSNTYGKMEFDPSTGKFNVYINGTLVLSVKSNELLLNTNAKINGSQAIAFRVSVTGAANAIFSSVGDAPIKFNTKALDTDSAFNTTTYQFTAPKAGIYHFSWEVTTPGNSFAFYGVGTTAYVGLYKNGTRISPDIYIDTAPRSYRNSMTVELAANDVIKLGTVSSAWYDAGGAAAAAYFEGRRLV